MTNPDLKPGSNPDRWEKAVPGAVPEKLYAKSETVHNQRIDGPFRRFKWFMMIVTLTIYYVTPWLRWDRGPFAPDQAVLVDLANRRFYMFGIEIWPHEFYFVAGLLIMAGIGLFLVTSAVGRAWCGYSCPQTVWTDLYQHVDRFFDGDRNARLRLDKAPWGPAKIARRLSKWTVYLLIAFATGGAWILYFADAPTLLVQLVTFQAPYVVYATIGILTFTTFVFGGFLFRHDPRLLALLRSRTPGIFAVRHQDFVHECRLPGTRPADDPDHLRAGNAEADLIDSPRRSKVLRQPIDLEHLSFS